MRTLVALAAAALLLTACGGDVTSSDEYQTLLDERDELAGELEAAQKALTKAEDAATAAVEEAAETAAELADVSSELEDTMAQLEETQLALEVAEDPLAGEIGPWPEVIKTEFIEGCTEDGTATQGECECMVDELEKSVPLEALVTVGMTAFGDPTELDLSDPTATALFEAAFACFI